MVLKPGVSRRRQDLQPMLYRLRMLQSLETSNDEVAQTVASNPAIDD